MDELNADELERIMQTFAVSSGDYGEDPSLPYRAECARCGRDVAYLQLLDHDGGYDNACVYCVDTRQFKNGEWVVVKGTMPE